MSEIIFISPMFNPRRGVDETLEITINQDSLRIDFGLRTAVCEYQHEDLQPKWGDQSLLDIFKNSYIYPPIVYPDLMKEVLVSWRNKELSPDSLNAELKLLVGWLVNIIKTRPNSNFWRTHF